MSGVMPTLCSRASASLLFLSRSESSWPAEDPPPASAPRFESPYREEDKLKPQQQPGGFSRRYEKLEALKLLFLPLTSFFFFSSSFLFFSSRIWAIRCFFLSSSAFSSLLSDMTAGGRGDVTGRQRDSSGITSLLALVQFL